MHFNYDNDPSKYDVRVEFYPECAADFVFQNKDGSFPLIATFQCDDMEEINQYVHEFIECIKDLNIFVRETGAVVNMEDFTYEI